VSRGITNMFSQLTAKLTGKVHVVRVAIPLVLLGVLFIGFASILTQVWSESPRSIEVKYLVEVLAGNVTVRDLELRLFLLPYLNGSLRQGPMGSARLSSGRGYVNITFDEIKPHNLAYCAFTVEPFSPVSPDQFGVSRYETGISGTIDFQNDLRLYGLEKIVVLISVFQRVGFTSFFTVTEAHVSHKDRWYREEIRYRAVQAFEIMLLLTTVMWGVLLSSQILRLLERTRKVAETISYDFPYVTLTFFVVTTLIYIYLGLVGEEGASSMIIRGVSPNPWLNYMVNSPLNAFFHLDSSHFEGNMLSVLPWKGVPLGLLPLGFVLETVLKVKRKLILATYLLTPYLDIVGIRYGWVYGCGASLSLFGLTGICVVASYHSLLSAQPVKAALRILRFGAALYVGYAVINYIAGYLFPMIPERFTGLITVGTWKVDVVSHILSAIVPLLLIALCARRNPSKLFR